MATEVGVSENVLVDYFHFCREVCCLSLSSDNKRLIGGTNCTVEIDESKFFKRKYNKGRVTVDQKNGWVFGGICRESGELFMEIVPDRTTDTLYPIIQRYIKPGTRIISDEWRAYRILQQDPNYEYATICHKYNFVDPEDASIHTQRIENSWRYAKRCFPANSTRQALRDSYLQEYVYRRNYGSNTIHQLLNDIKRFYPWNPDKNSE